MITKDNRFNIIHISDTHISSKNVEDLVRIKDALVNDIKRQFSEKEIQSSIVCFTGDLINRGDYGYDHEKQYLLAIDNFILPLILDLNMDISSFFIIPGNHEIDKTQINEIYNNGLIDNLKNYDGSNLIDYKKEKILRLRLDGYRSFEKEVYGEVFSDDIVNCRKINVNEQKIGICLINTSWGLSSNSEMEKGTIIIGKNNIISALQKIKDCDYKICLMHHSVSWLRDEDAFGVEPLLAMFDIVLCGHSHYALEKQVNSPNGKTVYCMASELLPISYNTGYNLVRIDSYICTVKQRQYFAAREVFDANLTIENGETSFNIKNEDDRTLIFNACMKTKRGFESKINSISLSSLINDNKKKFDDFYVIPNLSYELDSSLEDIKKEEKDKKISPNQLISSTDNYAIYGKKEYGKSMLLYYLAEQYYKLYESKRIPFIIDCKNIKNKEKSIFENMRNYINDIAEDDFKISISDIERMLNTSNCVLLFDNFSSNLEGVEVIASFVKKYSNNKRFFTITQNASNILENRIAEELYDKEESKYKRVYMNYLSKNDIRKLACNLTTCKSDELGDFTNKIITCFNKTYLPRTPFAVSLVVAVCNINSDFEPVNLAAVIKRFLEIVMDRLSPKELLSNEFNFDIKEDFLAFIAYKMVLSNNFEVSIDIFDKWNNEYHDYNGFSIRESHFDNYFFVCNILSNDNKKVSFKYKCLLEYYIGKKASIDKDFLEMIISKDKYINFIQELIYCTGIDTRNKTIIERLGQYLSESLNESLIDTTFLSGDRISLNLSISEEEIKLKVIEKQMTEAEIDSVTDIKDNSSEYLPAMINKENKYESTKYEIDQFDVLLIAFGNVVRNTELTGFYSRFEAYKMYVKGSLYWCSILAKSVEELMKLVRRDIIEDESIKEKIDIEKIEEAFRDFCKIIIPCMAISNMFDSLGTKKLGKVFIEYYNSINHYDSLDKFFALLIVCELKLPKWKDLLEDFMKNSTSKDLTIILFFKLIVYYRFCHFGIANNQFLVEKLFELNKRMDKSAGALYGQNKTSFINKLRRDQKHITNDD